MSLVTSAMSLLERIFFWRPDALPLLGGIKASKQTTASSSSLLPFVRVRQCVTSGDSKNKQGEGEGGRGPLLVGTSRQLFPPCWAPLHPRRDVAAGGVLWIPPLTLPEVVLPHLLSPSSPFKRWLLVLSSLRRLTFNFLATTMPTFVLYHHHDAQHSHSLPSPHIQSARHLLHLTPTMPPMMMHVFLLQLLPTNTKYEKQTRPKARWTQGIAVINFISSLSQSTGLKMLVKLQLRFVWKWARNAYDIKQIWQFHGILTVISLV